MADVSEMDADLVFSAGFRVKAEQGEWLVESRGLRVEGINPRAFRETLYHLIGGSGGGAVRSYAVLYGDAAFFILAQGGVDYSMLVFYISMHDGQIHLLDFAVFPNAAQIQGGWVGFRDYRDAAGFAIEAIYQVGMGVLAQVQTNSADQAGIFIGLGWVTDQACWFV